MDAKVCNVVLELESWWEKITPLHLKFRGDFEPSKDKKEKSLRKKQILLVSIGVLSLSHASPTERPPHTLSPLAAMVYILKLQL